MEKKSCNIALFDKLQYLIYNNIALTAHYS